MHAKGRGNTKKMVKFPNPQVHTSNALRLGVRDNKEWNETMPSAAAQKKVHPTGRCMFGGLMRIRAARGGVANLKLTP